LPAVCLAPPPFGFWSFPAPGRFFSSPSSFATYLCSTGFVSQFLVSSFCDLRKVSHFRWSHSLCSNPPDRHIPPLVTVGRISEPLAANFLMALEFSARVLVRQISPLALGFCSLQTDQRVLPAPSSARCRPPFSESNEVIQAPRYPTPPGSRFSRTPFRRKRQAMILVLAPTYLECLLLVLIPDAYFRCSFSSVMMLVSFLL